MCPLLVTNSSVEAASDLVLRVHKTIQQHQLLPAGKPVLIGVSGGIDSVVLLHLLHRAGAWPLHVAHFNHCLRGAESDGDESFAQSMAASLGLPFVSARGDVEGFAELNGISIEMAARELRHQFFLESAQQLGVDRIALAHHADDQIETFWLRLLRGDVGPGLTGMRWSRPARAGANISIVRPLLGIAKSDLIHFARENEISFRDDSSNSSPDIVRNRLRLEIIARLKTFQPALREVTLRTIRILAAEKDFLEKHARDWLKNRSPAFLDIHVALQREILRLQLLELGLKPNFELIESLRSTPGLPVSVSPAQSVLRADSGMVTALTKSAVSFSEGAMSIDTAEPGRTAFEGVDFEWQLVTKRGEPNPGFEYFDADQVGRHVTLRHWRRGDRFHPIGMSSDAKLQDLFTNWKVPAAEKRRRLLAADSRGKIFWVEGLRISEPHKVIPQTAHILKWAWQRNL
jgi:tRNA(Ile)-lysidine synthase